MASAFLSYLIPVWSSSVPSIASPDIYFFNLSIQPGDFVHTLGDAHVYLNHTEPLKGQVGYLNVLLACLIAFFFFKFQTYTFVCVSCAASARDPTIPQTEDPEKSGENR